MPPKTALLVIDMQYFFGPMTKCPLPNIINLCKHFSSSPSSPSLGPIIFTQHGHPQSELVENSTNQLVRKWGPNACPAVGSSDWKILDDLRIFLPPDLTPDSIIPLGQSSPDPPSPSSSSSPPRTFLVPKNTYDAFINTNLAALLSAYSIERVIICGVLTDVCCDTAGRAAFNRGYDTYMVSDACASANDEQHQAGLKAFGFAFGKVVTTEEMLGLLATS